VEVQTGGELKSCHLGEDSSIGDAEAVNFWSRDGGAGGDDEIPVLHKDLHGRHRQQV
jgi:hypothetical protein